MTQRLPQNRGLFLYSFFSLHSLGHQGERFSAHGRTRHQLDHHVFAGRLKMDPCHLLQHGGQGCHVTGLCAGVSSCCVQDVSPVHHQQQHMSLAFFLQKKKKKWLRKKGFNERKGRSRTWGKIQLLWLIHNIFYMFVAAAAYLHILQSFDTALRGTALNSQLVETLCVKLFLKKEAVGRKKGRNKKNRLNKGSQQEPLHPAAPLTEA